MNQVTAALAATNWNGAASTLSDYVRVADSAAGAVLSVALTSGGTGVAIATIDGATTATTRGLRARRPEVPPGDARHTSGRSRLRPRAVTHQLTRPPNPGLFDPAQPHPAVAGGFGP